MLKQNISLKDHSNYKIGGTASYFCEVNTKEELINALKQWKEISADLRDFQKSIFVLGSGTNILFSDEGFEGLVIKNSITGIEKAGVEVFVGAGTQLSELVDFCVENSLSGVEWAGGLPGTVGGAIRGNAGAFEGETKDNVLEVVSLNLNTLEIIKRGNKNCGFSYRNSIYKLKAKDEIILSGVFNLSVGKKDEIKSKTNEKVEYRKQRHPLEYPNIGSIFKNIPIENIPGKFKNELMQFVKKDPFPVVPAAKIIYLSGLKGKKLGDVMVSEKHTNFIVNLGNGKAKEVKELVKIIKKEVKDKYSMDLEEEIMYVGGDLNG